MYGVWRKYNDAQNDRALHEIQTAAAEMNSVLHVLHGLLVVSVRVCVRVCAVRINRVDEA